MAYPDYGDVPGNRGWILLRRPVSDTVEFMFVSFWDSMEALVECTGGDPERPKYYPEESRLAGIAGRGRALRHCGPSSTVVGPDTTTST
jgi:hypothetical protein